MVFYFSGTGNSYYIAEKIAQALGEKLISIAELIRNNIYTVQVRPEENIGFVYPVHACAPPDIVTDFIKKVEFKNYKGNYMYSVYNCAGRAEYTSRIIKEACLKRGFEIQGFYEILMPGNYVTVKKHLPEEKVKRYLAEADGRILEIVKAISDKTNNYKKEKHSFLLSYVLHKLAVMEKEVEFTVGEQCKGCGQCVRICSMKAISLKEGRPIRDMKKCTFCLGCVNVCPTQALQVGKKTIGNPRYVHSIYKNKLGGYNEKKEDTH